MGGKNKKSGVVNASRGRGLSDALRCAEDIAARDGSSLYTVSRFFADRARYEAFVSMYAVMREVDDRVDGVADKALLSPRTQGALLDELEVWRGRVVSAYAGARGDDLLTTALAASVRTFPVPIGLWHEFLDAMRYDVTHDRFPDYETFLRYSEGATVSPTAIFVFLIVAARAEHGGYDSSHFDFLSCGRALGRFAYIAHVLRDIRKDLAVGTRGLVYLATADLAAHDLDESALRALVARGESDARFARLVSSLCERARAERAVGIALARSIWDDLPPDRSFVFRLIVGIYSELLDRLAEDPRAVLQGRLDLDDVDKARIAEGAARAAGFDLRQRHDASA